MNLERFTGLWYRKVKQNIQHYPKHAIHPQALVSVSAQRMFLVYRLRLLAIYPVSTSRFGVGAILNSYHTPLGVHCVAEKIGEGVPLMTRFIARKSTEEIARLNPLPSISSDDAITTRILWLTGLEKGYNSGGYVDSKQRYIYIHGTVDEKRIGRPSSVGCIRMKNTDICKVFNILCEQSLVDILQ